MPHSILYNKAAFLLCFLLTGFLYAQQPDPMIAGVASIDAPVEYYGLSLTSKDSDLTINDTVVVHGDLLLEKSGARLSMAPDAVLIVYGNFISAKGTFLDFQNYLFIHGNFEMSTGGGSGAGNPGNGAPPAGTGNEPVVSLTNARFYIFGSGTGWTDIVNCGGTYDGNTESIAEACDFGDEADFILNFEDFDAELRSKLNCYGLVSPLTQEICDGTPVTFDTSVTLSGTNYQWQVKTPSDTEFRNIASEVSQNFTIPAVDPSLSGNQYRVIAKATAPVNSECKITISEPATLIVLTTAEWIGTQDTNWNNMNNWRCYEVPDLSKDVYIHAATPNDPEISTGPPAQLNNIEIEEGAIVTITDNILEIAGTIAPSGNIDSSNGTIKLSGSASQNLPTDILNFTIRNLEVNNTGGLTLSDRLDLTGWLKLTAGDLVSNGNLVLISSSDRTALVEGSGTGEILGDVTIQRHIDPAFGYKYISSPFSNSTVGDLSSYIDLSAGFPQFYRYDEARTDSQNRDASGWVAYTGSSSPLNILEGYAANFGSASAPVTVELTGTLNKGDFQKNLINNNGEYTKGFHLVGNPYPSPIDWNSPTGWTKNNIDDAIYFFMADNSDQYSGTYTSFVNGISSSDANSSSIIPSMQGFFVHVSDPATGIYPSSGTLGMTNETRISDFTQEFHKTASESRELIRISAGFDNTGMRDAMVIYFQPSASNDFDKDLDALKLLNTNQKVPNFYSISAKGQKLSINALSGSANKSSERIPLGLMTEKEGMLSIALEDIENLPESLNIYLIDNVKQTFVNLREEEYKFQSGKATHDSRFYLSFSHSGLPEIDDIFPEPFSLANSRQEIAIKMNLEEEEKGVLRICNINGQLIDLIKVQGKENISIRGIKSSGVYLLTYISEKRQFSKKILVKK